LFIIIIIGIDKKHKYFINTYKIIV